MARSLEVVQARAVPAMTRVTASCRLEARLLMARARDIVPFLDLAGTPRAAVLGDLASASAVAFMAIPQSIAYAMIAGLPPVMGLYAACIPTMVGSLFRSSRHVVTGPTNALSLLVGASLATNVGVDPVSAALLLALLVGCLQVVAGVLRLGVLVDYISSPVVLGYITGAGILIGVGQLPNLTATVGERGDLFTQLQAWLGHLDAASWLSLAIGAGAAVFILLVRWLDRRLPAALLALTLATALSWLCDLGALGVPRLQDQAPVPQGLPPLTIPSLAGWTALMPLAIAATVLSLVESSAVARSISARTGQRLHLSSEFVGQGLANVSAAFTGGYPTSGSLSRSAFNEKSGARTRLSAFFSGAIMLLVLMGLGPVVNHAPIAALAGILVIVAIDLVDPPRIRRVLAGRFADMAGFLATLIGTWSLPLDQAIYLGVGISLVLFLRRARLLVVSEFAVDDQAHLQAGDTPLAHGQACARIRILQLEGHLFFGAAGELQNVLDEVMADTNTHVLVLRIKRTQNLDYTAAMVLQEAHERMRRHGRHLFIVGLRPEAMALLTRTGVAAAIGETALFPSRPAAWFQAVDAAVARAVEVVGEHECAEPCPLARYLSGRDDRDTARDA